MIRGEFVTTVAVASWADATATVGSAPVRAASFLGPPVGTDHSR